MHESHFELELALQEDQSYNGGSAPEARLVRATADLYAAMYISQAAHWNVTGPDFQQYHDLFQESYEQINKAIDDVAEQARMLRIFLPRSLPELLATSSIPSAAVDDTAISHLTAVLKSHEMLKAKWDDIAANSGMDAGLNDLASRLSGEHAKLAWKLRSVTAS